MEGRLDKNFLFLQVGTYILNIILLLSYVFQIGIVFAQNCSVMFEVNDHFIVRFSTRIFILCYKIKNFYFLELGNLHKTNPSSKLRKEKYKTYLISMFY